MINSTEKMRNRREAPSRLKLQIAKLRATEPNVAVFVFEGKDDKLAYRSWIKRCNDQLQYEPLVASGKDAVLNLRSMIARDLTGDFSKIFYFVDKDFDGLRDHHPDSDIFCTERYSIENYLATEQVLDILLCDYFGCHGNRALRQRIIEVFTSTINQFCELTRPINERIFFARKLGIAINSGIPDIGSKIRVGLHQCESSPDLAADDFIRLQREPSDEEVGGLRSDFVQLRPTFAYRGKFLMEFFRKWLRKLIENSAAEGGELFAERLHPPVDSNVLGVGVFALQSQIPEHLPEFFNRMLASSDAAAAA